MYHSSFYSYLFIIIYSLFDKLFYGIVTLALVFVNFNCVINLAVHLLEFIRNLYPMIWLDIWNACNILQSALERGSGHCLTLANLHGHKLARTALQPPPLSPLPPLIHTFPTSVSSFHFLTCHSFYSYRFLSAIARSQFSEGLQCSASTGLMYYVSPLMRSRV